MRRHKIAAAFFAAPTKQPITRVRSVRQGEAASTRPIYPEEDKHIHFQTNGRDRHIFSRLHESAEINMVLKITNHLGTRPLEALGNSYISTNPFLTPCPPPKTHLSIIKAKERGGQLVFPDLGLGNSFGHSRWCIRSFLLRVFLS